MDHAQNGRQHLFASKSELKLDRRAFLGGAAALALPFAAPAAVNGMYVSLNGSLVGNKAPWPEFARLAAQVGYGGADLALGPAMKEGLDSTRDLLAGLKLRTAFCSLPVNATRDDETFRTGMQALPSAAKFASEVGCPRMVVVVSPSSDTPKDEWRKTLKTRYTEVGKVLADHNVRLGYEFLGPLHFRKRAPYEFIWRMNEMLEFARECGPNVGLLLDVWHWYHSGATVGDIIAAGKSRIVTIHLSDCAKLAPEDVRDNQRLMPGEGVIDLMGFFGALKKIGYEDGVSPEPIGRIPPEMSAEYGAKLGLETTVAVMRKAGVIA
jgi:sugar phosphate isomerase/epimerase